MGKERVAPPGYYITFYGKADKDLDADDAFGVVYISLIGKCKYIHWWGGDGKWGTLSWVSAPTKKKLQLAIDAPDDKEIDRYIYATTHKELLTFSFLHQKPAALEPPVLTKKNG